MRLLFPRCLIVALLLCRAMAIRAEELAVVPKTGEFPPRGAGEYAAGELVSVDHVNRRGALRLVGDGNDGTYHGGPSYRFAMLPYGSLRYHGAPAELRDIPLGTVLHGYFLQLPKDDTAAPENAPPLNQALTLEDDFSFYERQGQMWKIVQYDAEKGKLKVQSTGQSQAHGLKGEQPFEIDASTRVWKGREIGKLADIAPEQEAQLNTTWAPDWQNGQHQVTDVWLDAESRAAAAELQRQVHIRNQHYHWLAGWIDRVEHQSGSSGIVTVTLFGGMDPSLYEEVRAQGKPGGNGEMAAADSTLRTWWQPHDAKYCNVLECIDLPNPPPGSSGLQLRVQISELLEGFRPGRIVRLRPNSFPRAKLPPEERIKNMEDRS